MSQIAELLKKRAPVPGQYVQKGAPVPGQYGRLEFKPGVVDEVAVFWTRTSQAGNPYLSGTFWGRSMKIMFRDKAQMTGANPYAAYSYLAPPRTDEQKAAGTYPEDAPFVNFWENTTRDGVVYLTSLVRRPTKFARGVVMEVWPAQAKANEESPDWYARFRQLPKAKAATGGGAGPTSDEPVPDPTGVPNAGTGVGEDAGDDAFPF